MNYKFKKASDPGKRLIDKPSGGTNAQAERVLIVDDELSIRMLLTRILKDWGYAVKHVGTALEALEAMAAEPADILFCDVTMPEHDGLWLAEQVHARWPDTAIIMATAHDDPHTVRTSRKVGAVAYITKPFRQYLLRETLDRVAGR
jgi:DNA-binding NtrC family response regulator